ncbi:MAG: HNH endonuclease [Micrococcus sp.]|nr:HNH endonuclease [Micrococcus sp.]
MRTLVLNAGYEPLAVVSDRRALLLVDSGKASVLAAGDEPMASPSRTWGRPLVILLHRYVRVPHADVAVVSRRGVLRRDRHLCAYCGAHATTVDHIHPRSRGGGNTWENLVACCSPCNTQKGDRSLESMGWRLQVTPMRPRGVSWRIRELERPAEAWREYLQLAA